MINPSTGWSEMAQIPNKMAAEIADITKKTWFTCYSLPQQVVFDCGTGFMAEVAKMCQNKYGLKSKSITTRNTQPNAIIERIYETIGNIIRTFEMSKIFNNNPLSGIQSATMFATCATYHTTQQAYPMQLVFGQYAILNIDNVADWEHIRKRKQERINCNNKRKNMRRNNHQYKFGDKILVKREKKSKHEL